MEFISKILPNVSAHPERFFNSFVETLIMTLWAGGISFVIGLLFGLTFIMPRLFLPSKTPKSQAKESQIKIIKRKEIISLVEFEYTVIRET